MAYPIPRSNCLEGMLAGHSSKSLGSLHSLRGKSLQMLACLAIEDVGHSERCYARSCQESAIGREYYLFPYVVSSAVLMPRQRYLSMLTAHCSAISTSSLMILSTISLLEEA